MSTSRNASGSPTSKKLSSCVRPGVFDVRARLLRLVSALSSDDLPTFDRPANATSGTSAPGRCSSLGADLRNAIGPAKVLRAASIASSSNSLTLFDHRLLERRVPRIQHLLLQH